MNRRGFFRQSGQVLFASAAAWSLPGFVLGNDEGVIDFGNVVFEHWVEDDIAVLKAVPGRYQAPNGCVIRGVQNTRIDLSWSWIRVPPKRLFFSANGKNRNVITKRGFFHRYDGDPEFSVLGKISIS